MTSFSFMIPNLDFLLTCVTYPVWNFHRQPTKEIADDSYESIVRIERGGEITWHGPGMLMLYPIFDLTRYEKSLRWYVTALEEVIIRTVANFGIEAHRSTINNGVWVKHLLILNSTNLRTLRLHFIDTFLCTFPS